MKFIAFILTCLCLHTTLFAQDPDPSPGAKKLGQISFLYGDNGTPSGFVLYELWGVAMPVNEEAFFNSAAATLGIKNVISVKLYGSRTSSYDIADKLRKNFPKKDRSSIHASEQGSLVINADGTGIGQKHKKFLSNDYRNGIIPERVVFSSPQLLGSIIVACGPKDERMTSFKVYEWYGTAYPKNNSELYGDIRPTINEALGLPREDGECRYHDFVKNLTGQQAADAFKLRLAKDMRNTVRGSVEPFRINTVNDGFKTAVVTRAGQDVASGGNNNGGAGGSSEINYSTADMSEFLNNSNLGAMILYFGHNKTPSAAYIYELIGRELKDKQGIAALLANKIDGSTYIGFEVRSGSNCDGAIRYIRDKAGNSIVWHCNGSYKVN